MEKLLSKIEGSKIRKITNEIKINNYYFKEYLGENRIGTIKYEDVVRFEQNYEKNLTKTSKSSKLHEI